MSRGLKPCDESLCCAAALQIDDSEEEKAKREELKASYEPLCRLIKDILADKVEKVRGRVHLLAGPQSPLLPSCRVPGNPGALLSWGPCCHLGHSSADTVC